MVRVEQRYWPSSSSVAWIAAGEQSWKRSELSTARTGSRSSKLKARAGVGRATGAKNGIARADPAAAGADRRKRERLRARHTQIRPPRWKKVGERRSSRLLLRIVGQD